MILRRSRRLATAATLMAAALTMSVAGSASAAPPEDTDPILPGDPLYTLAAGQGCPGFALQLTATAGKMRTKEFQDEAGNTVRVLQVGTGISYTYTNLDTGRSVTTKASGSATQTVTNADGTLTVTATGHNGLIMFPSDVPAGPTATAYQGRIVYTIDPATGVFTLLRATGASLDICAALD